MTFYVKIQDQNEFRTSLLESAREPLLLLKAEKEFLAIRDKKLRIMKDLRTELSGLLVSIKKLDDLLPEKLLMDEMRRQRDEEERSRKAEEEKIIKQLESQEIRRQQQKTEVRTIVREIGPDTPKFLEKPRLIQKKELPKIQEPILREIPKPKQAPQEEPKSSVSDMDRLEYTLSKIESKLRELKT